MKKGLLDIRSLASSRNAKYSTINIAFCAIVVAIAIMINSIFSVCADAFGWYADMTGEQIFTLSDQTIKTLDQVPDDVKLEIIFPLEKDRIEDNFATSQNAGSIGYVHSTALEIASELDNIEISYHNTVKEPAFYDYFSSSKSGVAPSPSTIIVARKLDNGSYGEYRSYRINSFYVGNSKGNLYAYNGEAVFATAILALSFDYTPTVYFTTGHGEKSFTADCTEGITSETIDTSTIIDPEARELMRIFCLSNFTIKSLDLKTSNIPDDARVIIMNQPKSDINVNDFSEDAKIRAYLNNSAKTFYCFTGSGVNLPNLYSLMEMWTGAKVEASTTPIVDTSTVMRDQSTFLAKPPKNNAALAYFGELTDYTSAKALVSNTVGITITDDEFTSKDGKIISATVRYTLPVLYIKDETIPVMTVTSSEIHAGNKETFSYLALCTSEGFTSSSNLLDTSVSNKDMIYSLIHSTAAAQTLVDIDHKTFINYKLDITDRQAKVITVLISSIVPLALVVGGIVVIRRRKLK